MAYEVKFLSKEEVEEAGEYWSEWEQCSYLGIFMDGELKEVFSDGGEPEDNSFGRDWNWVPFELEVAYKHGLKDGRKE